MLHDSRLLNLFNIRFPLLLAPMAGAAGSTLAIAVSKAGGLGSIACPMLSAEQIRREVETFRTEAPGAFLNLNFFCHKDVPLTEDTQNRWMKILSPYFNEFGVDPNQKITSPKRNPFNEETCALVEELKPEVVSFHFGLPEEKLLKRVKDAGCFVLSSATTKEEALWLEEKGCDAIIVQGLEAGGHRGHFLKNDLSGQLETMDLLSEIISVVKVPFIPAGGISDGKTINKYLQAGAAAVQIGTAYLFTHEATISPVHRKILLSEDVSDTAITNLFTGRPARGIMNRLMREIGPMNENVPPFPHAGIALAPLKAATEKSGSGDFMSLWAGQSAGALKKIISAKEMTEKLIKEAML